MQVVFLKRFSVVILLFSLTLLIGCAGMELAPKYGITFYPKELSEADRAVEEARQAGKDSECPNEFQAVEGMKDKAYEIYLACRTEEAITMAEEATEKAKALCAVAEKPVTRRPRVARVIDRMTLSVTFDFDKATIRKADEAELERAVDFVEQYPDAKIMIEGHTDSTGPEQYNQQLSEQRAEAVKRYLVEEGDIDESLITTIGYGETRPIATNNTRQGRAKNRRVEILILSE